MEFFILKKFVQPFIEMENLNNQESKADEEREVRKLDNKLTQFDKISAEKVAEEEQRIRDERRRKLREEMARFEEEKLDFENDFEQMKNEVIQRVSKVLFNGKGRPNKRLALEHPQFVQIYESHVITPSRIL